MSYFVIWRYSGRTTLYNFESEVVAREHATDLGRELPPHASVALYRGEMMSSISRGSCGQCPDLDECFKLSNCARIDLLKPGE